MTTNTLDAIWAGLPEDVAIGERLTVVSAARAKLADEEPAPAPIPAETARALIDGDPDTVLADLPGALAGDVRRSLWERTALHLDQVHAALVQERRLLRGSDRAANHAFGQLRRRHGELLELIRATEEHLTGITSGDQAIARGRAAVEAWRTLQDAAGSLTVLRGAQFTIANGSTALTNRWPSPGFHMKSTGIAYLAEPIAMLHQSVIDPARGTAPIEPDGPWDGDDPIAHARWEAQAGTWLPTISELIKADATATRQRTGRTTGKTPTEKEPVQLLDFPEVLSPTAPQPVLSRSRRVGVASDRDLRWAAREAEYAAFHAN